MADLSAIIHNTHAPLVKINSLIAASLYDDEALDQIAAILVEKAIDRLSMTMVEMPLLYKAINYTITKVGAATVLQSLMQPPTSLELIVEKQNAVREIDASNKLRTALINYLEQFQKKEVNLFSFLDFNKSILQKYEDFSELREAMINAVENIPKVESKYLQLLVDDLKKFSQTPTYELLKDKIYLTKKGIQTATESNWKTLRLTFNQRYAPRLITILPLYLSLYYSLGYISPFLGISTIAGYMIGSRIIKRKIDADYIFPKLHYRIMKSSEFYFAIDAIGKLDEILSFTEYSQKVASNMVLPRITDDIKYHLMIENMRNPISVLDNPKEYIAQDCNLTSRATLITGPNGNGRTLYLKTIAQIQLLAQIGCYIPATNARINIADDISYTSSFENGLSMKNIGKTALETLRHRTLIERASPRSLILLDDFGNSAIEKIDIGYIISLIDVFISKGASIVMVTDNHEIIEKISKKQYGNGNDKNPVFFRGKCNGSYSPTYQFEKGIISREDAAFYRNAIREKK